MRGLLMALILGAALGSSGAAVAAGIDPASATAVQREQAQARYKRGKEKFDGGDYAGAQVEFAASLEIVASPNARLYAARSLEKMGRLVEAYAEFGRTAVEAKELEHEDGRYGKAGEAAAAERELLAPKLGFVDVSVDHAGEASKLIVASDEIRRAGWTEPVPVLPGTVDVEVDTPGHLPVKTQITATAGAHVKVSLDADAGGPQVTRPLKSAEPVAAPASRLDWTLPAGIAAGGIAVAGLVTFGVAGLISESTYNDLKQGCPNNACPPSKFSETSDGKTQQVVANVGLAVGVLGAAASTTLLVLYFTHKTGRDRPAVGFYVSPWSGGLSGRF